jgi:glycosyltransferase involved in cell wall biosynthesis
MKSRTLLQINSVVNSGSTGRIAEEIGSVAIQNDWKSFIAYGRTGRQSKSDLIKIGTKTDIQLHGIETRLFDRHGLGSKNATIILIEQIKKINPVIIHLHNLHGYYINIEVLFDYLNSADIPVVWTLHDCWAITGHCSHFELIGCEKWKTHCFACPQKTVYPGSILFDRSSKNFQLKKEIFTSVKNMTIVPVSEWLSKIVQQSFLSKYPSQVINNGIDLKTFSPQKKTEVVREKYGIGKRFMLIGVATAWSKSKGLYDFIKLSKVLPDDCVIVLVGLTKTVLGQLPEKIIGLARTESTEELALLYSAADLYVNATYEDSFPTTNVEALACGTPVVTYRTGGSAESVTNSTGFVIEQGNIDALLKVIEFIKYKGNSFYAAACREQAIKLYNKDDRFMDYIDLYESILNPQID